MEFMISPNQIKILLLFIVQFNEFSDVLKRVNYEMGITEDTGDN